MRSLPSSVPAGSSNAVPEAQVPGADAPSPSFDDEPRVSIIINTDGRAKSLSETLDSLRLLDYSNFEVCVVHGPTPDGTKELLETWSDRVKVAYCPTRNLSRSRNIGLALAAGVIVAFLDDDALPEPEWLKRVAAPFKDPVVGACGGFLWDHTGVSYQWRFGTCNRMGLADTSWNRAAPELNFPFTANYPAIVGANSVFLRSAIMAIGGFDEQYAYFLDETDVICRLVDRGYHVIQLDGAAVHHKFAASHIRSEGRLLTSWYAIIRSKVYFSIVNAHGHHDVSAAIKDAEAFAHNLEHGLEWGISSGKLTPDLRETFKKEFAAGLRDGLKEGLNGNRLFYDATALAHHEQVFKRFAPLAPPNRRRVICFLTQSYPPGPIGGIGRYIHHLARAIAALGHQVHVLTKSSDLDTVDLEDGVWVHRVAPKHIAWTREARAMRIPQNIWDYSARMLEIIKGIAAERAIDVVYAPIWDCEGIAILLEGTFRLVTGLQTTLAFWLDSHEHMRTDEAFMTGFATPMLNVERYLFENSDGIHAISAAIGRDIEQMYDVDFSERCMAVVPLGHEDWSAQPVKLPKASAGSVRLLFVGRLEKRKGIDTLLETLPGLLAAHRELVVDIVGNDELPSGHGGTYRKLFETAHAGQPFVSRVRFHGEVDESELLGFYKACDLFVAPSRFESFGLILLEAMMFSKPVVACRAGGMPEVVEEGVCGMLVEPGDAASLAAAIDALVGSPSMREEMGRAGRRRYEATFTPNRMADGVLAFLADLTDRADAWRPKDG